MPALRSPSSLLFPIDGDVNVMTILLAVGLGSPRWETPHSDRELRPRARGRKGPKHEIASRYSRRPGCALGSSAEEAGWQRESSIL